MPDDSILYESDEKLPVPTLKEKIVDFFTKDHLIWEYPRHRKVREAAEKEAVEEEKRRRESGGEREFDDILFKGRSRPSDKEKK